MVAKIGFYLYFIWAPIMVGPNWFLMLETGLIDRESIVTTIFHPCGLENLRLRHI